MLECIIPDWPAPANIQARTTTRTGGVSRGIYRSLNLATHVGDDAVHVARNREILHTELALPAAPRWLEQVHGQRVVRAESDSDLSADAAWTSAPGVICAVLTADCLPVFVCDRAGSCVALAHAGWRGLHAGVISATLRALPVPAAELMVWLGPAIGPRAFEVGADVYDAFVSKHADNASAFSPGDAGHWWCDIYRLARIELLQAGVTRIYGGDLCSFSDHERFYSYRRDGETGRMASLVWMQ